MDRNVRHFILFLSDLTHPPVSPSRWGGSYSPRLRDPAHNLMAICRRRVNVTREIIKSSRGTRAAISDDAAALALHIKRPYPHRHRRRGTRADCVNAAMHTKACRACARTYFAIQKGSDWGKGLSSYALQGLEFQSRTELKSCLIAERMAVRILRFVLKGIS